MEGTPILSYRDAFIRSAAWRFDERRRVLNQINRKDERDKEREKERAEQNGTLMDFALGVVVTSDSQIAAFTAKLDS